MISFKKIMAVALVSAVLAAAQDFSWYYGKPSPYYISTEEHIKALSILVNDKIDNFRGKTIILSNDITLSENHTPIGLEYNNVVEEQSKWFIGTFDGGGHSISNVSISGSFKYAGFFGVLGNRDYGQIKNLVLNVANINVASIDVTVQSDTAYVGGLAGFYNSTQAIENCGVNISGSVTSVFTGDAFVGRYVGGLVGGGTSVNINNSYATGDVAASITSSGSKSISTYSGGLVGGGTSVNINNSYATGNVSVSANRGAFYSGGLVGGLVGSQGSVNISDSYATGDVSATGQFSYSGGLVGSGSGRISSSYATGDVSASISGGLVGSGSPTINNSYATGNVSASDYSGGLVGSGSPTINNSYATGNVSASNVSSSNNGSSLASSGGLVGSGSPRISNSYATGDVSASSNNTSNSPSPTNDASLACSGGLVGRISSSSSSLQYAIINCYASGTITAVANATDPNAKPQKYAGGFFGLCPGNNSNPTPLGDNFNIVSIYYNSAGASGAGNNGAVNGVTGTTSANLKSRNTFEGWDFENIWGIDPAVNGGYPHLRPFVAVSDISVIDAEAEYKNGSIIELNNAQVSPSNATYKDIVWSVTEGSAQIQGGNLTVNATVGTVKFKARIINGLGEGDFEKTFTVNVKLAGVTVSAPTLSSKTHNSITINAVTASNGQPVEYALTSSKDLNVLGFTRGGTSFRQLAPNTVYYIYARSSATDYYYAGARSAALEVTTDSDNDTPIRSKLPDNRYGILLDSAIASQSAKITIKSPEQARVNLVIYDNLGNAVFEASGINDTGIVWNLTNKAGRNVANGAYLVIVEAKGKNGKSYWYSAKVGVRR